MDRNDNKENKNKNDNNDRDNKSAPRVPRNQAVALKYDKAEGTPKVIAKGSSYLADRILNIAENENIPVYEDEQLVKSLSKLDLGETIPPELFEIVAHIYAFLDRVDAILDLPEDVKTSNSNNKLSK